MDASKNEPGHKPILKPMPRLDFSALWKDEPACIQCGSEWRRRASNKERVCGNCKTGRPNE